MIADAYRQGTWWWWPKRKYLRFCYSITWLLPPHTGQIHTCSRLFSRRKILVGGTYIILPGRILTNGSDGKPGQSPITFKWRWKEGEWGAESKNFGLRSRVIIDSGIPAATREKRVFIIAWIIIYIPTKRHRWKHYLDSRRVFPYFNLIILPFLVKLKAISVLTVVRWKGFYFCLYCTSLTPPWCISEGNRKENIFTISPAPTGEGKSVWVAKQCCLLSSSQRSLMLSHYFLSSCKLFIALGYQTVIGRESKSWFLQK